MNLIYIFFRTIQFSDESLYFFNFQSSRLQKKRKEIDNVYLKARNLKTEQKENLIRLQ